MASAVLAGGYACQSHGVLYTYDANWEHERGTAARWSARIFHDRRIASPSGACPPGPNVDRDPAASVLSAIHAYIDQSVCAHTCRWPLHTSEAR